MRDTAPVATRASSMRWAVLAAYALLAACTQLLWLTFAAVDTRSAVVMKVDLGAVGDLAAIFPFVYIVLALPTGRWLDMRFGQALGVGAVLTGGGALVRLVAPNSFGWQLAGQLVIATGQPLVMNSITKVKSEPRPSRLEPRLFSSASSPRSSWQDLCSMRVACRCCSVFRRCPPCSPRCWS